MNERYREYMLDQLRALMDIDSPSGYTDTVQEYLMEELCRLGYAPEQAVKGGVRAYLGGEGDAVLLLSHVDTLGAVVDYVKSNGRLLLSKVGGLQANNVETENVRVCTRFNGTYEGTIQLENAAAHVNREYSTEERNFDTTMEVVLDEFVGSDTEAARLGIRAGDYVCVEPRFRITEKGYIKSRFLDDKASAAVLLTLAKYLREEKITPKRKLYISFTVYEEVGHGACCFIPEDVVEAISVDMGCVGDEMSCTERQVSICAKDACGPYHYGVTTALLKTAIDHNIDYAMDVYHNYGSDVDAALSAGHDVRHALIGPGVYASHGYERTHIDGLKNTFDLLLHYLTD